MSLSIPLEARGTEDRWARTAGMAFLDGAASEAWGTRGLAAWFQEHLVAAGHMLPPISVSEPPVFAVTLYPHDAGSEARLPALLGAARASVLDGLRGFLGGAAADRFVTEALFGGRIRRASASSRRGPARWVPRPEPEGALSAVVLSLFAIDVLTDRASYEHGLCVCDECGRVSFEDAAARRRSCAEHGAHESGTRPKVMAG